MVVSMVRGTEAVLQVLPGNCIVELFVPLRDGTFAVYSTWLHSAKMFADMHRNGTVMEDESSFHQFIKYPTWTKISITL